ncbi:MAG TPA: CsgG/HfaB family protein [Myxococcota bacterium]|nr:CsgG/HfaB family protein [Myxococcota bacterium]
MQRLRPAEINLPGVRVLAVGDVAGRGGDDVADLVAHELLGSGRFDLVDRQRLFDIVREQGVLEVSSSARARDLGALAGADALLFGRVSVNTYDEDYGWRTVCDTSSGAPSTTYSRQGSLRLGATIRVTETLTGRVVGSLHVDASRRTPKRQVTVPDRPNNDPAYLAQLFPAVDVDGMRADAYVDLARQVRRALAPHFETVQVTLYASRSVPESAAAVRAAQAGDWDRATRLYELGVAAAHRDPRVSAQIRARAHYNLGVALGYGGRAPEGIAQLRLANTLYPDPGFEQELARLAVVAREDALVREAYATGGHKPGFRPHPLLAARDALEALDAREACAVDDACARGASVAEVR